MQVEHGGNYILVSHHEMVDHLNRQSSFSSISGPSHSLRSSLSSRSSGFSGGPRHSDGNSFTGSFTRPSFDGTAGAVGAANSEFAHTRPVKTTSGKGGGSLETVSETAAAQMQKLSVCGTPPGDRDRTSGGRPTRTAAAKNLGHGEGSVVPVAVVEGGKPGKGQGQARGQAGAAAASQASQA